VLLAQPLSEAVTVMVDAPQVSLADLVTYSVVKAVAYTVAVEPGAVMVTVEADACEAGPVTVVIDALQVSLPDLVTYSVV